MKLPVKNCYAIVISKAPIVTWLLFPCVMLKANLAKVVTMGKKSTAKNKLQKLILVLSDSELLFSVISANLHQPDLKLLQRKSTDHNGSSRAQKNGKTEHETPDLIIVANSSPFTEPVVALAEAALNDQVGRTPLLIISDRNFATCREKKIFHLDFPFDPEILQRSVGTLLDGDLL